MKFLNYYVVKHAQVVCARCDELSPVVPFRDAGEQTEREAAITAQLNNAGWDVQHQKSYCPACRRIGG
jgi:hypothetical protein